MVYSNLTMTLNVLASARWTNLQYQFINGTFQPIETTEMQQKSIPKTYQTLTSWLADSHVKRFLLQEKEEGSMTPEELSFLRLQGFSKTKDPDIFYWKTFEVYYLTTREKLSRQYLKFSPTWGIMCNGHYLTRRISKCPKGEREFLLRDILEENVEGKYYLSEETAKRIMEK